MRKRRNLKEQSFKSKSAKTIMSLLLCGCMLFGSFTIPTYADGTESTEAVDDTEAATEATVDEGETDTEAVEVQEENTEAAEDSEAEQESTEAGVATYAVNMPQAAVTNDSKVTAVKLKTPENSDNVWGTGILTGSTDLDDKSWVKNSEENRGYDDSQSNDIIRSFDSIYYSVSSTFDLDKTVAHTLVYEVTLPDDDELVLDEAKMNAIKPIDCIKNADGTKTYICKYTLEAGFAGGEKNENVIVKVGGKKQGDEIRPVIKAYLDDDKANALEVNNMETVTVTTAPFYNIVLEKKTNEQYSNNIYNFAERDTAANNYHYKDNAAGYKDSKVNGYRITYGFGLEITKPGGGIKGVEIPDASTGITFDVDISKASLAPESGDAIDIVSKGFGPLLFYVGPNQRGGGSVTRLPMTQDYKDLNYPDMGCYNSGNITVTQEGTKLHFSVKDFAIDQSKFPKQNIEKNPYWTDSNKIKEGVFSVYQFQLVYPYVNDKAENFQDTVGNGTINVSAKVENISATSVNGTSVTQETNLNDNEQSGSWPVTSGSNRNQQVFYSKRDDIAQAYTTGQLNSDSDVAAVGANDLAFTIQYGQQNVSDAGKRSDLPIAVEQFVLFDRNAITNVEFNKRQELSVREDKYGYDCEVLYAVRKDGRMDNEAMRSAQLEDFDFYTDPQPNCDGVLVKYKGMNLGDKTDMGLYAQFKADVNTDSSIEKKVYMVTAFTNVWTVADFQDEILRDLNKTSINNVTRQELGTWAKDHLTVKEDGTVNGRSSEDNCKIDNRTAYTVPNYNDGAYAADERHKFSITWADGLYIVPYTTTIAKSVAQTDENGEPLQRYNIGARQRYVDYKISSSINYEASVNPVEGAKTIVYIEDKIPKGLKYIADSAYIGGTYKSDFPRKGSVTGGTKYDPVVTNNADGTTTLKWTIENVPLKNGKLENLYYSCEIDKDIAPDASLKNTVNIQTTEDKRPIAKESYNTSDATVTVTKSSEFYIKKSGNASLELNDEAYYTLEVSNTSATDKTNLCVFDTMPYDGDGKSTQFKGNYQITSLTMDAKEVNHATDMEIWYSDKDEYIGKTATDIPAAEVTEANGWKKAEATGHDTDTITFTGDGLIGAWPTVIAYKDSNLEKNTAAIFTLKYKAVAATERDNFVNKWTTMSNEQELRDTATTDVYNRTIEGTVWFDKDKDGLIGDNEKKLKDVKVTLLVKDLTGNYVPYTPYAEKTDSGVVQPTTENPLNVTYTDENGHYKFSALPEGEYQIKFESKDGRSLGNYEVTKANAGEDITKTSKVKAENVVKSENDSKFESGTITDIKMPSLDKMVSDNKGDNPKGTTHNLPDQNLGLIIPTRDIKVTKEWDDANNQDGKRPDSIKVTLYKDVDDTGVVAKTKVKDLTISSGDNWTGEFKNLPVYDENDVTKEISYSLEENVVNGYDATISTAYDADKGYVITNKHTPEITSVTVTKKWEDNNNQDGKRPTEITVKLLADGKEITDSSITSSATFGANSEGSWIYTFTNLPKYKDGKEIKYTVKEDNVQGYTQTSVEGNASVGFVITNKYTPEIVNIPVTKVWDDKDNQDGIRPDSITVRLYADEVKTDKTLELSKENNWKSEFTELDAYKNGTKITYTVQEDKEDNKDNNKDKLAGYKSSISKDDATGEFTITNTHTPAVTSVQVAKKWEDNDNQYSNRPEKITVKLIAKLENGDAFTDESIPATLDIKPDANGNWTGAFTNLPKYKAGKEIKYTIKEEPVAGYTSNVAGNADDGYIITNALDTTSVSGSKTWNDANNQDGKRPGSITINLLKNGEISQTKEVKATDDWKWSFENLPKYENGQEIVYSVTENAVAGYSAQYDGYNVTNMYTPGKTSLTVIKAWDDGNDQDGIRPETIKIHLYADGKDTGKELTLTAIDNWSGSFTDLDECKSGNKIDYTIIEDEVEGYTTAITGDATTGYVITNTHTPTTPDEPNEPDEPDTPEVPDTPKNPNTPSVPETPQNPSTPENPAKPQKPDSPTKPEAPKPQQPSTTDSKKGVKTGDTTNPALWILMFVVPCGVIFDRLRRRKNK